MSDRQATADDPTDALRRLVAARVDQARMPSPAVAAKSWIAVLWLAWLPAQLLALLAVAVVGLPEDLETFWVFLVLIPFGLPAVLTAGAAALLTLRNWSSFGGHWIVVGLIPWLIVAAEALAVFVTPLV